MTFQFLCYAITRAHADSMQWRLKRRNAGLPCSEVDASNDEIPGTHQSESFSYSADTYEGQYYTRKVTPSAGRGRYAFRIVRTNNGSDQLTDQAKLEEVYSVQVRSNVVAEDTLIRCVTTATEQATGIKDRKFNAEVTRKTITWNGSQVVNTLNPSRSFADAVLHSFVVIAGRDASELDLDELYSIDASIKSSNERLGWFDFSFDDMDISLRQRLQTICNAARVTVFRDGLKWRFVREEKKPIVSAQFDARNLANDDTGGTLQYRGHLPTSYDGVELEWVNASDTNDDGTDKKAYIRLRVDAASKQILEEGAVRPYKLQLAGCRNKNRL
ncbi:host specificity factor TipJ family phage tail protein [Enterobacter bugandensis]|uniref:host specificity factor TipJ family phage tail protein n=1 Tax=Enterobacter bugandensis TaxID=881260 RepID=UPI0020065044|nr:host specificity factor TipJ family phage tail protein [Enterobacter bugandensis]